MKVKVFCFEKLIFSFRLVIFIWLTKEKLNFQSLVLLYNFNLNHDELLRYPSSVEQPSRTATF